MIAKTSPTLGFINLQGGWPTPRLHPVKDMEDAAASLFTEPNAQSLLIYGPEHGSLPLRKSLGKWLTTIYRPTAPIVADRVIVTNGASNGLATILQKFSDPTYTQGVWMVEPTYFLACPIFRDAGLADRIRGVPEGDDGIDLDFLSLALQKIDEKSHASSPNKAPENGYPKIYRHIIYMIPTFSNPSGKTMTLKKRESLIQLARKHDALIVTDDVYDALRWPATRSGSLKTSDTTMPRLVDVDRLIEGTMPFGNAVSNGSFSKIISPGVRVGWLESTPEFINAMGTVGATVSGGCQSHMASLIIERMLTNNAIARHIDEVLIPTYQRRYYSMVEAIHEYLYPYGTRIVGEEETIREGIAGGFFLYITFDKALPQGSDIARYARENYSLQIAPGDIFAVTDDPDSRARGGDSYARGARLCWAWNEEAELVEGIKRLAASLKDLRCMPST